MFSANMAREMSKTELKNDVAREVSEIFRKIRLSIKTSHWRIKYLNVGDISKEAETELKKKGFYVFPATEGSVVKW